MVVGWVDTVSFPPDTIVAYEQALNWPDYVVLAVQVLTLIALIIYVVKTAQMAKGTVALVEESRASRKLLLAPRVVIYFDPDERHFAHIVVKNVGAGTAANVRFDFEPPLETTRDRENATAFFDTPKLLPPGAQVSHYFDTWQAYLKSDLPKKYEVTITCYGAEDGVEHVVTHELNTTAMRHLHGFVRHGMHDLVEALEDHTKKVERALKAIRKELWKPTEDEILLPLPLATIGDASRYIQAVWLLCDDSDEEGCPRSFISSRAAATAIGRAALTGILSAQASGDEESFKAFAHVAVLASQPLHHSDWSTALGAAIQALDKVGDGERQS